MTTLPNTSLIESLFNAVASSADGFALFDQNDQLLYANNEFRTCFGLDASDIQHLSHTGVLKHALAHGKCLAGSLEHQELLTQIESMRRTSAFVSYDVLTPQGTVLINESLTDSGIVLCLCSGNSRYTQLCRELDEQEHLLQQLLLHSQQPIIICDLDDSYRIVDANDAALKLLKYDRESLLALPPEQLSAPTQTDGATPDEAARRFMPRIAAGESVAYTWNFLDAAARVIPCEVQSMRVHKTGNRWIRCTLRDTTEQRAALQKIASQEKHLQYLRHYDTLTELPNRVMLTEQLNLSLQNARLRNTRVALLIIDIDRFKLINDSLGYRVGDQYLVRLGGALRNLVRDSDTVGRLGADEFAIILEGFNDSDIVAKKARLILQEIARPIKIDTHELISTVSIGIALFPDHCNDTDELLRQADTALHEAKQNGKNTFAMYHAAMATHLGDQLQLANDLRRALQRNEFHLVFQPQVRASSGRIFAAEVLLRWTHPVRGFVSPAEFIPVAEETGLITDIGQWVLEQSVKQMQQWRKLGIALDYIAVNISPRQFNLEKFVEHVEEFTRLCQLPPQCLQLELTENLLLDSTRQTIDKLQRLSAAGFSVAIDDFGTGYSSLSYLKRFPLQKLKIDRSFVADVTSDPNDAAIVRAIIAMANSLNLDVIAEGVETAEQVAFLQALGCNEIQGYFYSKPLPEPAFVDFAKSRQ